MNPNATAILAISIVVGVIVVGWRYASRKGAENFKRVAQAIGLSVDPESEGIFNGPARATGVLRGKKIEMHSFSTGSGRSRKNWCAIDATPAVTESIRMEFDLRRQGFGTKLMQMFGWREIEIGDPDFDARWFIQTNRPEYLRAALLPEIRDRLDTFAQASGGREAHFKLESSVVRYAEQGSYFSTATAERVGRAAEIVCDLADLAEVYAASVRPDAHGPTR